METTNVDYKAERAGYYKVLVGLLLLTAVTFIQPHMFMTDSNFMVQMFIGTVKAWMILIYYMHLKGEKLIGWSVLFSLLLVVFFYIMVIIDVNHFQFLDLSHITSEVTSSGAANASAAH
ncbi:cytochrome C oxidase subunit IV family protein [Sulfurimonas sp.]|nr:cytochrome C oxidase subunit IV family protein [Sulfurimonas sp.]